jgi:hypothetical protein
MKPVVGYRDLAVTQAIAGSLVFLSIPFFNFFGTSSHALLSVLHGLGATMTIILAYQAFHQIFPLLRQKDGSASRLELTLWLTNILILGTIVIGNWLYIGYREPDGVEQWLLGHRPIGHLVFMEFKEFIGLFPLPLGIAAAFLLRRFRSNIMSIPELSSVIAILVSFMCLCLLMAFVFGIGLAKIKMV